MRIGGVVIIRLVLVAVIVVIVAGVFVMGALGGVSFLGVISELVAASRDSFEALDIGSLSSLLSFLF